MSVTAYCDVHALLTGVQEISAVTDMHLKRITMVAEAMLYDQRQCYWQQLQHTLYTPCCLYLPTI